MISSDSNIIGNSPVKVGNTTLQLGNLQSIGNSALLTDNSQLINLENNATANAQAKVNNTNVQAGDIRHSFGGGCFVIDGSQRLNIENNVTGNTPAQFNNTNAQPGDKPSFGKGSFLNDGSQILNLESKVPKDNAQENTEVFTSADDLTNLGRLTQKGFKKDDFSEVNATTNNQNLEKKSLGVNFVKDTSPLIKLDGNATALTKFDNTKVQPGNIRHSFGGGCFVNDGSQRLNLESKVLKDKIQEENEVFTYADDLITLDTLEQKSILKDDLSEVYIITNDLLHTL